MATMQCQVALARINGVGALDEALRIGEAVKAGVALLKKGVVGNLAPGPAVLITRGEDNVSRRSSCGGSTRYEDEPQPSATADKRGKGVGASIAPAADTRR